MSDPTVTTPDGKVKTVKNLGWLLRHKAEVNKVTAYKSGWVRADLNDGRIYRVRFADTSVMTDWLDKRFDWTMSRYEYEPYTPTEYAHDHELTYGIKSAGVDDWNKIRYVLDIHSKRTGKHFSFTWSTPHGNANADDHWDAVVTWWQWCEQYKKEAATLSSGERDYAYAYAALDIEARQCAEDWNAFLDLIGGETDPTFDLEQVDTRE